MSPQRGYQILATPFPKPNSPCNPQSKSSLKSLVGHLRPRCPLLYQLAAYHSHLPPDTSHGKDMSPQGTLLPRPHHTSHPSMPLPRAFPSSWWRPSGQCAPSSIPSQWGIPEPGCPLTAPPQRNSPEPGSSFLNRPSTGDTTNPDAPSPTPLRDPPRAQAPLPQSLLTEGCWTWRPPFLTLHWGL